MSADLEWEVLEYLDSLPDDPFKIALELWRNRAYGLPEEIVITPLCVTVARRLGMEDALERVLIHRLGKCDYQLSVTRYPSPGEREKAVVTLPESVAYFQRLFDAGRFRFLIEGPIGTLPRMWLRVFHPWATRGAR